MSNFKKSSVPFLGLSVEVRLFWASLRPDKLEVSVQMIKTIAHDAEIRKIYVNLFLCSYELQG